MTTSAATQISNSSRSQEDFGSLTNIDVCGIDLTIAVFARLIKCIQNKYIFVLLCSRPESFME